MNRGRSFSIIFMKHMEEKTDKMFKKIIPSVWRCFVPILLLTLAAGCGQKNASVTGSGTENISVPEPEQEVEEEQEEEGQKEEEQTEEEQKEEEQKMSFVDAWGETFEMAINPRVAKHTYHWEYLKNSQTEISYTGDEKYTVRKGLDVSHHQGEIDWEKVKADGYEFAFIRIGYRGYGEEGTLNLDSKFDSNIAKAHEAGMDVGVYLFSQAINGQEALEEAEFVIKHLEGHQLELPVVFDPEQIRDGQARTDDVTASQFTQNTHVFCEKIREAGYEPMVYSNLYWEAFMLDMEQLAGYGIWYADYEPVPQTPYQFEFWQFTEKGAADGISGDVDLNLQFCPRQ